MSIRQEELERVLAQIGTHAVGFKITSLCRITESTSASPEGKINGAWAAAGGWIARESGVTSAASDIAHKDDTSQGRILEAELFLKGKSLQIRRVAGRWLLVEMQEKGGEPCLSDERRVVTVNHGIAVYRRYWSMAEDGAADVVACRLTGFEV